MSFHLSEIVQGLILSLIFILATGPIFFYMISLSMRKGFRAGALFAVGVVLSDVIVMIAINYGLGKLFELNSFKNIFSCFGALLLLSLGIFYLMIKKKEGHALEFDREVKQQLLWTNLFKGLLMNLSNPLTYVFWLTLRTTIQTTHPEYDINSYYFFFIGLFGGILCIELTKVFLAEKIGKLLTAEILFKTNKLLGLVFVVLSTVLMFNLVKNVFQLYD